MKRNPPKKRISVASAKAKGRDLQKWVCQKISELTDEKWGKDCPIESRPMGQTGVDVRMEFHVWEQFPYSVECKWQESWSVPAWIKQAQDNQREGTDWLLFLRRNRMNPYSVVVMDADVFFELLRKQHGQDTTVK